MVVGEDHQWFLCADGKVFDPIGSHFELSDGSFFLEFGYLLNEVTLEFDRAVAFRSSGNGYVPGIVGQVVYAFPLAP